MVVRRSEMDLINGSDMMKGEGTPRAPHISFFSCGEVFGDWLSQPSEPKMIEPTKPKYDVVYAFRVVGGLG